MDVVIDDNFITIDSLNFFGQYVLSPNKRFTLSWDEKRVLLFDGRRIVFSERKRIQEGAISDEGTCLLVNSGKGNQLSSKLFALLKTGEVILEHKMRALINNCGISRDGRYAVCQTCNSDYEPDCGMFYFFDLIKRTLVWKITPEAGWAHGYDFDTQNNFIIVKYDRLGSYRYTFEGKFIDRDKFAQEYREKRVQSKYCQDVLSVAEEMLSDTKNTNAQENESDYPKIESLLKISLEREGRSGKEIEFDMKARVYRRLGELAELRKKTQEAIIFYEKAIQLYPKIGVKLLIKRLKANYKGSNLPPQIIKEIKFVRAICHNCHNRFKAEEKFGGKIIKCPKCGNSIQFSLPERAC
jgi:hypothetical protein